MPPSLMHELLFPPLLPTSTLHPRACDVSPSRAWKYWKENIHQTHPDSKRNAEAKPRLGIIPLPVIPAWEHDGKICG